MRKFSTVLLFILLTFFRLGHMPAAYADADYDAGMKWARENEITDPHYSGGRSDSFNDGVQAYVERQIEDQNMETENEEEGDADEDFVENE